MKILLVDDDRDFGEAASQWLTRHEHVVHFALTGREASDLVSSQRFDVAVIDLMLPDTSGIDLLQKLKQVREELEVVILTGSGSIESAVEAMRCGAYDYLTKPFPLARLAERCRLAADHGQLLRENRRLKECLKRKRTESKIIGTSPAVCELRRWIRRVAATDKPVLIQGESGTGKELVAQAVQQQSARADQPFLIINCAALPESLVESELFGHERGAFTGAISQKDGLFEVADRGTILIDELGELPLALQAKLLRILENGTYRRVGSHVEQTVDVRLIAATNRDLAAEVAAGRFREDLYYRINVLTLTVPPLRERIVDLPDLISHYLPAGWQIESAAERALRAYHWPGNIRQLIHAIERAAILADDRVITLDDLPAEVSQGCLQGRTLSAPLAPVSDSLEELERKHVIKVLQSTSGNKSEAARALGVHRRTLYRLLDRLGLNPE